MKILLAGTAVFNATLFFVLTFNRFSLVGKAKDASIFRCVLPYILLLFLITLIAYWCASRSEFIYHWDLRNYWSQTERLYQLMISGTWKEVVSAIVNSFTADYSLLPAVIPAIVSLFIGYPSRLSYELTISVIYAVPAYVMVAYLAKRLLEGDNSPKYSDRHNAWVFSSLPVLFGFPAFLGTTLLLIPDIGGVIFFCAALLNASEWVKVVMDVPVNGAPKRISADLLRSSLGLGMLLSLMFLFRRWYVFASIGISLSCLMLISIELWFKREHLRMLMLRMVAALTLGAFSALSLLSWVIIDWSRNVRQHDYVHLYSAWKHSLARDGALFVSWFGLAVPIFAIACIMLMRRLNPDRRLSFILVTSTVIACLLFMQVQSPTRHHYFLLMPIFGASLAAFSMFLFRRYGLSAAIGFTVALVGITWATQGQTGLAFQGYEKWLPHHERYAKSYQDIAAYLVLPENRDLKFCTVVAGRHINQGKFSELWQIAPVLQNEDLNKRLVILNLVDSLNGPPSENISQCDIALVGEPYQSLIEKETYTLKIIQQDLLSGTGIGAAFRKEPAVFIVDENVRIYAYKRARDITSQEYNDLVRRFLEFKGPEYVNPRKL